jgi:hypothetical protein
MTDVDPAFTAPDQGGETMARFAVTLSNEKILNITAPSELTARRAVEQQIADRGSKLTVTGVRLITGTAR